MKTYTVQSTKGITKKVKANSKEDARQIFRNENGTYMRGEYFQLHWSEVFIVNNR